MKTVKPQKRSSSMQTVNYNTHSASARATPRSRALLDPHQAEATRALAATVPEPHRQEEPAYAPARPSSPKTWADTYHAP